MSDHSNDEPPDGGFVNDDFGYNQDNSTNHNRQTMNDDNILGANAFQHKNQPNEHYEPEDTNGFDYAPEDTNTSNNQMGFLGQTANALGGNADFGDALGLDGAGDVDEMMEADMGLGGDVEEEETKMKIRVFINFDEDDDNDHAIDLNHLFKRVDQTMPYYVDIQLSAHCNCKELIVESLDLFNKRLADPAVNGQYTLNDNQEQLEKNYSLYIAKKKGIPKDDFPGMSLLTNVKGVGYERFSLCCFSSAFIKVQGQNVNSVAKTTSIDKSAYMIPKVGQADRIDSVNSNQNESMKQLQTVQTIHQSTEKVDINGKSRKSKSSMAATEQQMPVQGGCCNQGCTIF